MRTSRTSFTVWWVCRCCRRLPFSRRSITTAECQQQQQQQRGRGRGQSGVSSDDVSSVGISSGGSCCISLWRLLWSVPRGAMRAGFALVPCAHARFCEACAM